MIYDNLWIFVTDLQIIHMGSNLGPVSMTNISKRHRVKVGIVTDLISYSNHNNIFCMRIFCTKTSWSAGIEPLTPLTSQKFYNYTTYFFALSLSIFNL